MNNRREKLITLRREKGWFQKDVVLQLKKNYKIEITESYYGMIEQGVRTPKLPIAFSIADLLGVEPQEIFFSD